MIIGEGGFEANTPLTPHKQLLMVWVGVKAVLITGAWDGTSAVLDQTVATLPSRAEPSHLRHRPRYASPDAH